MKVFTKRGVYECASVEQHLDGHYLLNEDGSIYVRFPQFDFIEKVEDGEIIVVEQPEDVLTQLDIIEAQVTYTAMMTDTLLEV